jgi:hypothetical protein
VQFKDTAIPGVCEVLLERSRTSAATSRATWCAREFAARGCPGLCPGERFT